MQRLQASPLLGEPETVLVVDDDEAARAILSDALAETRFRVEVAAGGREGVRLARELKPAAVFLDLRMPDLGGREALDLLRSDPATVRLPIVIHTAKPLTQGERAYFDSQSAPVLAKVNADRTETLRQIREVLALAGVTQNSRVCP